MAKKPAKRVTLKAYERSGADRTADRKAAKKAGVSAAKWEGSKADMKADRAAVKKLNSKKGRK